jgi:K+-sensing histidine kinase KdpD
MPSWIVDTYGQRAVNRGVISAPPVPNRSLVMTAAVLAPLLVCALLIPFRGDRNTNSALLLVLVIVAIAASGLRPAGVVAALSSALWFDFFLTKPYQRFNITDRVDLETTVLLLLVGAAVTELALWGRRQQARSSQQDGYLQGILSAASSVGNGASPPSVLIDHVAGQLTEILDADGCTFDRSTDPSLPQLNRDGTVTRNGHDVNVDRSGLPTDSEIELPAHNAGLVRGRFVITAATRVARPNLEQRLVAVALADQVGAALTANDVTS